MALQASLFFFSSSSFSFSYEWPYDVFLSFRGSDTRHGFTGNLYKALSNNGIHTFFDDQELEGGEEITPALVKAIQDSRIAIVVFSLNYASSSFCLHELATIMECVKGKGRLVLPVFYDVDPCDVRHQKGSYGEAMNKHEERFKDKKEKLQKWREALRQAADLSGEHFKPGNEYEYVFIQNIVKMISKKIWRNPLYIADYPIGLESRVLKVNELLNDGSDGGVLMVGIYGIGGIGKSTLARAIYNSIADQFEGSCFLENVRERTNKVGLVSLQETLLSEMLGEQNIKLGSVHHGVPIIKQRLHRKKVLLVLDDVDELKQLRAIVGGADWLGFGSRVIITTRDKHLLASHRIERNYEVEGLSKEEALELLCWNAFKDENIDPTYMDILKHAVTYACGLPLALEVIGPNLFGKSIEEWRSALNQYEKIPEKKIQKILEISFDALEECQQKMFLDIACFSNGYNWKDVNCILHVRHDNSLKYGISVLVQKSLVKVDKFDRVTLHDLIRDMGREIIRRKSPEHPGNRSRLWLPRDVVQVLEDNTGTNDIEIMTLDPPTFEEPVEIEWDGEAFKEMKNLEILIIRRACFSQGVNHLPNSLRVLEWWNYPSNSLPSNFHPKELVIFNLPRSRLTSIVFVEKRKFMKLKSLYLDESMIEQVPDLSGVPNLEELSFLRCENLTKVHESVGFLKKLCYLWATDCSKLKSFPALMLPSLKQLDLSGCSSLENFPKILGHIKGITEINWEKETSIKELPSSISNLSNLTSLTMRVSGMLQLPNSIATLPYLKLLDIWSCGGLQVPKQEEDEGKGSSMVSTNVETVWLQYVPDESIQILLAWFCNVVELHLSDNDFTILPESIKELCSLRELFLDDCKKLTEIRGIPPNIKTLSAANCMSLTPSCRSMLLNEEYHSSNGDKRFHLPGSSIPEWFEHRSTNSIFFRFRNNIPSVSLCVLLGSDASRCTLIWPECIINGNRHGGGSSCTAGLIHVADHITIVESKSFLECDKLLLENEWNYVVVRVSRDNVRPSIKEFGIHVYKHESNTEDIQFIESRGDLDRITLILVEANIPNEKQQIDPQSSIPEADTPIITQAAAMPLTDTSNTTAPAKVETLSNEDLDYQRSSFEVLKVSTVSQLKSLPLRLHSLKIEGCESLETLPDDFLGGTTTLKELYLISCSSLRSLPCPGSLTTLYIRNCRRLEFLPSLESRKKLASLHHLFIGSSCDSLTTLNLNLFLELKILCIWDCPNLSSFHITGEFKGDLASLESLEIRDCPRLVSFPVEGLHAPNLASIFLSNCKNLNKLPNSMNFLTSLKTFFLHGCPEIESFPFGGLPSSLTLLSIAYCDKLSPQKDWGLNILESLNRFELEAGCIGMESFPDENLLPRNINSLRISTLPSLKELDYKGFQHLNALQTLEIHCCDMLRSLPVQGLPSSLNHLCIQECPLLTSRLKPKTGKEWHKVARIPHIQIDH